jgi:hypothetical protein
MVRNGFNILNETHEIYYGSSTTESTFTAPNDVAKILQRNFVEGELSLIMKGKMATPKSRRRLSLCLGEL